MDDIRVHWGSSVHFTKQATLLQVAVDEMKEGLWQSHNSPRNGEHEKGYRQTSNPGSGGGDTPFFGKFGKHPGVEAQADGDGAALESEKDNVVVHVPGEVVVFGYLDTIAAIIAFDLIFNHST